MSRCPVAQLSQPFSGTFFRDPYPTYERMHEEGPVHRIQLPEGTPAWLVTRYQEASLALKDQRLVRNRRHAGDDYESELLPEIVRAGNLHMEDGQLHSRLRRFMNFAFTPRRIQALMPRIEEVTSSLLDVVEQDGGGDLMSGLAAPLPIAMTGDILGVPKESRGSFRRWSDALLGGDPVSGQEAAGQLLTFVHELIDAKRQHPQDDLISYWLSAQDAQGEQLSDQEITGMTFFLLLGGYDTTVGQIGASVLTLLTHPEHAEALRADPERAADAVEELMRFDGSTHSGIRRFALHDMEIGGVTIPKGDTVLISLGAANRDPRRFADPGVLDFDREDVVQLGFGRGPHHCPGKQLARAELRISLSQLVTRFPTMRLDGDPEQVDWRPSYLIRVPREVRVLV